ncbi:hypothetical protein GCM10022258_24760 [Aquimarina gracilis]
MGLTGYGQQFTADNITYQVIPGSSGTVAITGNTNTGDLIIPGNVTNGADTFTVTSIAANTFVANDLTKVTIPESITSIGANAFTSNPDLKKVVAKGANPPPSLNPTAFGDRSEIALTVPVGSITAYEDFFGWTGFRSITEEEIAGTDDFEYEIITSTNPNTVRITGYTGMATSVDIPGTITDGGIEYTVTHIGDRAFFENALTSVTIPNGVTHIGNEAFRDSGLSGHLEIPDGVESIGNDAFNSRKNGANLGSVTLPNSVTRIGQRAFTGHQLESVNIPDKLQVLEGGVFSTNSLNEVIIPESVTEIQGSAFNRNALASVTIPSSVTSIGSTAFANNNDLMTVGVESSTPPTLLGDGARVFEQTNDKHFHQITVIVPRDARNNYKNADSWNLYSINEELTVDGIFTYPHISFAGGGMHYQVISDLDRTVRVIGRSTLGPPDVTIPEKVFHGFSYTVTAIGKNAFLDNGLTSVEIPETVTSIGEGAFENNQLITVTLPEGVTSIKERAFKNSGLTGHLEIPNSATEIIGGAFSNNQLTSVAIPDNLETIEIGIFQNNLLTEVTIPANVKNIEKGVFVNNLELVTLVMKSPSPISLEPETFDHIYHTETTTFSADRRPLIDVIVPRSDPPGRNKHEYLTSRGWGDYGFKSITEEGDIGETFEKAGITYKITEFNPNTVTIIDNENTGDLTIPMKVERLEKGPFAISEERLVEYKVIDIEAGAFQNNQLTRVIIPDSLASIGANAFAGNPGLATVELEGTDPPSIEESTFADRDQIDVIVPNGAFDNYVPAWNDFKFKSIKAKVAIGDTFTVERDANTAVIKYEVTAFGPTNTVTVINNEDDDRRLLEIFDPVAHVGHEFKVTKIGEHAFADRNIIGALTIPDGVESIEESAFQNNQLTSATLPESVTGIGESAFSGNQLTNVTLPDGVESIEAYAFSNNALSSITIPNNVTRIGEGAFSENVLSNVDMPESIETIGHRAFALNSLTQVNIPNGVTSIGDGAFQDNQLTSVTIPENVTGIGANAFTNNPGLTTVVSRAFAPPSIEESSFTNADRGQIDLIVPSATPPGRIRANYEDVGWTGFRSINEGIGLLIDAPTETADLSAFTVTFRFDQDVTGFTVDDIDFGNATANHFTGSGSIYTVEITPRSCDGTITIDVPVNAVDMSNVTNFPASASVAVNGNPNDFVAIARNIIVQLDANGGATISPEDINNGSYGCGGSPNLSLDIDSFDCDDVGTPVTVTLTAAQGDQTATATAMVTVFGNCGSDSGSPLTDFNSGFSPNGDGIADSLVIEGLEQYGNNVVKIYNLSQRLLFSAHYGGPGDAWDGTHKGSRVPVGSYVCIIDYNEPELGHETKMIYVNY